MKDRNDIISRCKKMWTSMKWRVKHDPDYKHVEIRISRDDFMIWAEPRVRNFLFLHPNEIPSVDRPDPDGHYELPNMRIRDYDANRRASRFICNFLKLGRLTNESERIDVFAQNIVATCKNAKIDKNALAFHLQHST